VSPLARQKTPSQKKPGWHIPDINIIKLVLLSRTPPPTNVGEDEGGGEGALIHCWECKLVQPLWKTIWRLLKKLNIDLPYDPAIPFLGIYPKECDSGYYKGTCSTIHNS
jgi:hypothetical protein